MTEKTRESVKRPLSSGSAAVAASLCFLLLILFLSESQRLNEWMQHALSLCADVLIPSLFPFLILSDLILSSGAADGLGRLAAKPFRLLLGISGAGVSAVILGMLCGFPIGARVAISLYEQGKLEQQEAERLLAFCSIPSPAFLIGTVGSTLLGSHAYGWLLYGINVLSAFLICLAGRMLTPGTKAKEAVPSPPSLISFGAPQITRAIAGSMSSMLQICAFVLAFSCLIRLLGLGLSLLPFAIPPLASSFLFGFLELTGGITHAAALPKELALVACAAISGWSGLSVHAQIVSLAPSRPLSFRPYLLSKALSAFLCALIAGLWVLCRGRG